MTEMANAIINKINNSTDDAIRSTIREGALVVVSTIGNERNRE
jgi:hypothetical protein